MFPFLSTRSIRYASLAITFLSLPSLAPAQERGNVNDKARAALALAKAQRERLSLSHVAHTSKVTPVEHTVLPYAEAMSRSIKEDKICMVRVAGFDCQSCCGELKNILVGKIDSLYGDSTPRVVMSFPHVGKTKFWKEWTDIPTPFEAERAMKDVQAWKDATAACQGDNCSGPAGCEAGGNCSTSVYQPTYQPIRRGLFFGGGGLFGGGGCAGGSCGSR